MSQQKTMQINSAVNVDLEYNEKAFHYALDFINTPFRHMGRNKFGMDCIGLILAVGEKMGRADFPSGRILYARVPSKGQLEEKLDQFLNRIDKPIPGCIILTQYVQRPTHVAILGHGEMIHCTSEVNKCVKHVYDKLWKDRTVRFYSWDL